MKELSRAPLDARLAHVENARQGGVLRLVNLVLRDHGEKPSIEAHFQHIAPGNASLPREQVLRELADEAARVVVQDKKLQESVARDLLSASQRFVTQGGLVYKIKLSESGVSIRAASLLPISEEIALAARRLAGSADFNAISERFFRQPCDKRF